MNPIEHVWDQIGRELETLDPRPANLQELSVAISQIWNAIPQEKIRRLSEACLDEFRLWHVQEADIRVINDFKLMICCLFSDYDSNGVFK